MNQKDYVAACAKFAESQRLDPSSGTLLNLARCYNLQGKTATAWAKYLEAGRLARQQNRTAHADEARARAAELEPNLSYLTIVVTGLPNDATIERDDVRLEPGSLGSKLPIDPGPHLVKVRAPGYKDQQVSVTIGVAKDAQTLVVPALTPIPGAAPAELPPAPATTETPVPPAAAANSAPARREQEALSPPAPAPRVGPAFNEPPPRDRAASHGGSAAPWILGGVGVVGIGVGATFGVLALGSYKDADKQCPEHHACSADAMQLRSTADTQAWIANIGVGAGIVGLGIAAVLGVSGSGSSSAAATPARRAMGGVSSVEPLIGPGVVGVALGGTL
jgi:hypothetical protein